MPSQLHYDSSNWIQWLPTSPALALTQEFSLVQAGPRERAACCSSPEEAVQPCWWDVQIMGWTNVQTVTVPGVPTLIDPRGGGQRNVPLHGILLAWGERIEFDIGAGVHFSVFAPSIGLNFLGPVGSVRVGDQDTANFVGTAIDPRTIQSAVVNGIISACARPTSTVLKLSDTRILAASADVPVPARARTLQIFEDTASLPATPMNWINDAVNATDIGQIDFQLVGAPARTDVLSVPAGAQFVRTGAQARTVTFVWGLQL